ncbi:MAG: flagellin [Acidimicrobiia bacterium]
MGLRINQNISAFAAYRNLSVTHDQMAGSLEKLSSGFRINRAADDAAGLVISENLRAQVGGLQQATRNAQDGINVVQTAEGALNEVQAILQRMRDLAVQSANTGSNDTTARNAAQSEVTSLAAELDRIAASTKFGNQSLLDGTYGTSYAKSGTNLDLTSGLVVQAGTNDSFKVTIGSTTVTATVAAGTYSTPSSLQAALSQALKAALSGGGFDSNLVSVSAPNPGNNNVTNVKFQSSGAFTMVAGTKDILASLNVATGAAASSGSGGVFQVGANNVNTDQISVTISAVTASALSVNSLDMVNSASAAITTVDSALASISSTRADLGAKQNRFQHTINNLNVAVQNLSASESQIRDTDMAAEMVHFTRDQILVQAGTAMLAQANAAPQTVLKLLQ